MERGRGRQREKISWSKLLTFWCSRSHEEPDHNHVVRRRYSRVVFCNDPDNVEALGQNYQGNYVYTTRYSPVDFIPKSLFEQFRRVANVYFLVVACVSYSPLAPYSPLSVFAPLAIVIGATMVKEAVEDWRRRRQDIVANNRRVEVYGKGHAFHVTRWKNLRVGDVVKVHKDQYFPADLLLLSSSYEDGICYVDTMNLDGETNLKLKQSLDVTSSLKDEMSLQTFAAVIKCEDPNENLYSFVGNLEHGNRDYPLSLRQILLRGSKLKNTDFIYGVAVFTGHDTKVMQNATRPPSKRSKIERRMDKIIYILFSALVSISCIGSVVYGIQTRKDLADENVRRWYLRPDESTSLFDPKRAPLSAFLHFLTGLMLYNYLIPISLYVSIEIVKVLQSMFINQDQDMYHKETSKPARARTSNLNEELGQVHTILSDKTGTLTCNSMEFVKCSIAGIAYGQTETEVERALARKDDLPTTPSKRRVKGFDFRDERIMDGKWVNEENAEFIREFFRALAICHTVIPEVDGDTDELIYEAESPDELAFVLAAREIGFMFLDRKQTTVTFRDWDFRMGGHIDRRIELLDVLEFTSTRKRMSVIIKTEENRLMLLSKGADSVMFERLSEEGRRFETETKDQIKWYSNSGLRIMVVAYRELVEEEYKRWKEEIEEAKAVLSADREDLVNVVADKIEKELILLGATAVEDKLQEGVRECIEMLAQAQINLWVLTGDKLETAINIGYACRLLRQGMRLITVTLDTPDIVELERRKDRDAVALTLLESVKQQIIEGKSQLVSANESDAQFGLIIDGKSLDYALSPDLEDSFLKLAVICDSVICCRSSPKQKALITRLVKRKMGRTTLAVGDGANDVGMIQEADIGVGISGVEGMQVCSLLCLVGISGVEGMQAAMASDFSIAQFRFLERLLLVHGHWCYRRIALMICYFFYKNITFGFTLFWFEAYTSFSGLPAYNDWYMSCYNVFFTSLPVIALGVFDQDVSARLCLKFPFLYKEGTQNVLFNWPRILGWMVNGLGSSIIIFFCTSNAVTYQAFRRDGMVTDYEVLGVALYSSVVWAVNCQIALSVNYFTWIHHFFIWGSVAVWYLFLIVYGHLSPTVSTTAYMVFSEACAPSLLYWLCTLVVVVSALLPYFSYRAFKTRFQPMPHDTIQRLHRDGATSKDPGRSSVPVWDERRILNERHRHE